MAKPRVRKLLDLRTDTTEFLDALDSLSTMDLHFENGLASSSSRDPRRYLRFDLEDRSLRLIQNFIREAGQVESALSEVKRLVQTLDEQSAGVLLDLQVAENATTRFVQESSSLREARARAERSAEETSAFLQRFQLSPEDVSALEASEPDARFFQALERVRNIRDECSELLSGAHQSTGLEVFEQMAAIQNRAQDLVYAWIKRECAEGRTALDDEEKRVLYAKAFAEFRHGSLPAYYSHGMQLCSQSRRKIVAERFSYQVSRQIDAQLDPLRALSDLLTTLHETVAEERDLFQTIFHSQAQFKDLLLLEGGEEDGGNNGGEVSALQTPRTQVTRTDAQEEQDCLERALGGTCAVMRSKAVQCLDAIHDSVLCFRAMQILDFYRETLAGFFPLGGGREENPLGVVTLLREECAERFFYLVETKASELLVSARTRALPGSELSASFEVLELVRSLRDVLVSIRDYSKTTAPVETDRALKAYVLPIRTLVQNMDQTFSSQADACIFGVNNLAALQAVLTLHEFTAPLVEELQFEIGERIDLLARIRAEAALLRTGMQQALAARGRESTAPPRAEQIKAAFDAFYRELSTSLVMPEFDRIDAPRLRHQARSATCQIVLRAHDTLFDYVKDNSPQHYADTSFLTYTKAQVADLLDV